MKTLTFLIISAVFNLTNLMNLTNLNAQVTQEWIRMYNGPGGLGDVANSIAVAASGNIYITGASSGSGTTTDYATIKYDPSGVEKWVQRYNGPAPLFENDDYAFSIVVDGSENVYVTGRSVGIGTAQDIVTIKYSASGAEQWVQRYNGPANGLDEGIALAV